MKQLHQQPPIHILAEVAHVSVLSSVPGNNTTNMCLVSNVNLDAQIEDHPVTTNEDIVVNPDAQTTNINGENILNERKYSRNNSF